MRISTSKLLISLIWLLIYTFFSSVCCKSNCQIKFNDSKITNETNNIVIKIVKVNELMGSAVYVSGMRPEQFDNFEELKNKATTDELIELTNHPNGVVRCYAFWALSYDANVDIFSIVLHHINDTELVETQFGCIGSREMVGDFYIDLVTPHWVDLKVRKLDSLQRMRLDSILIYKNNKLHAKNDAIEAAIPSENLYPRIRELVMKEHNQTALIVLAKYQKQRDVDLILNNKLRSEIPGDGYYFTYQAICEFPHPAFFPLLEKNLKKTLDDTHYSGEWAALYQAIAAYKNQKAIALLKIPFTQVVHKNIRPEHIDFVFLALQRFKTSIYDSLFWYLWTDEKKLCPNVFTYLLATDRQRVIDLTRKNLINGVELTGANYMDNYLEYLNPQENLTSIMLDLLIKNDHDAALLAIRNNIKRSDVNQFSVFADRVTELKDSSFIEPLFARLAIESNPHTYLKIVEALITYNDSVINNRILELREKNPALKKDWGGAELSKLLEQNNIH